MSIQFRHNDSTPCSFFFDSATDLVDLAELKEWFLKRQPKHMVRHLVNKERDDYGSEWVLIFESKTDAMEFKLIFL